MTYRIMAAAVFAVALCGQDGNFSKSMLAIKSSMDALAKLEKKTGRPAMAAAERIGGEYEDMIHFWRQHDAPDAVKISEEGKAAAAMLASAAYAGDDEKAAEALKTLGGTCKSCHDNFRERTPEGKYRIKQVTR
jgi:cytochrome c556